MSAVVDRSQPPPRQTERRRRHERQIAVENPATGEVIGHVDDMDAARVEAIVERARARAAGLGGARLRGARPSVMLRPAALARRRTASG